MKRFHLTTNAIQANDLVNLEAIESLEYENRWLLETEHVERKRMRRFKHRLAV